MTNYPVGDFIIAVKNASLAKKKEVEVASSGKIKRVADALSKLGYLEEVSVKAGRLSVRISYKKKEPLLMGAKLISKPGLRIYMSINEIESKRGPSQYLISTPKGVLSSKDAIKQRLGGEIIAEVW